MTTDPRDIERALQIAAQIVRRDGPEFLPVFQRLEEARAEADGTGAAMARALALAARSGEEDHPRK